jgi:hypothetical protein
MRSNHLRLTHCFYPLLVKKEADGHSHLPGNKAVTKARPLIGGRSHESQASDVEVAGETIPKCSGAPQHF